MATILVLEPSSELRELYALAIRARGHTVVLDPNVAPEQVDALIFEPNCPSMLAAARRLRAARRDLAMICATSRPRRAYGDELQPAAFIAKPFRLAHLTAMLDQVIASPDGGHAPR